jgi:DNA-binding NarL/FixJ family response regulator
MKAYLKATDDDPSQDPGLNDREIDIIQLAISGHRNKEIGGKLHLSEQTVKNCLFRATQKLRVELGDLV